MKAANSNPKMGLRLCLTLNDRHLRIGTDFVDAECNLPKSHGGVTVIRKGQPETARTYHWQSTTDISRAEHAIRLQVANEGMHVQNFWSQSLSD